MRARRGILLASLALVAGLTESARAAEPAPLPRIVVAFANAPATAPGPAGSTGRRYSGAAYNVSQSAAQLARRIASEYALHQLASWPIRELAMHCVVYEVTGGRPAAEVLAALAHDPRVALAQPLHDFHTLSASLEPPAYNDPLFDLQSNLPLLGIPEAHRRAQGAGVRVALIDTAVDTRHPDLAGRVVRERSFTGATRGAGGSQRHGTAMAGIIAAVANNAIGIVGIAPRAQLEVFAACWQLEPDSDAAVCNTFTLAQALAAALESGAPLVNLSVGGPDDPLLAALVGSGIRRGVIFVGARADEGGFPTAIPGVIAAAGSEGAVPPGTLAAPARRVMYQRPDAQYDFESGSSVAAAEITGVIALLMSATPERLSAARIVSLLRPDANTVSVTSAAGAVNAASALAQLEVSRRACSAARGADTAGCPALAGHALDGL